MIRENPLRIVMVDDDPDDIFLMRTSFKRCNMDVHFVGVNSGYELFQYIKNFGIGKIDIILLDINMPVQDGFEVLTKLRGYPDISDVKVIMCSTSKRPVDRETARDLGAYEFLVKPSSVLDTRAFTDQILKQNVTRLETPKPVYYADMLA